MHLPSQIADALDGLFDAAILQGSWAAALDRLAAAMGAAGAVIVPFDPDTIELGFPTSSNLQPLMDAFVAGAFHREDIRSERARPLIQSGQSVVIEHDLVTAEERRRLPYYQELFFRFGLPWFAGVGFQVNGDLWCLTLIRGTGQGPYTPRHVKHFTAIAAQLSRIVVLASQVRAASEAPLLDVANIFGDQSITLGVGGRVLSVGRGASTLVGQDLHIRDGMLRARSASQDASLQAVIRTAVRSRFPSDQEPETAVVIHRSAKPPLILEAYALPSVARDVFSRTVAIIVIRDLSQKVRPDKTLLQKAFGLTPSEAKLAALVGSGSSLNEAADTLNITAQTARTVLKRVYEKAGISRQSELALLVQSLAKRPAQQ